MPCSALHVPCTAAVAAQTRVRQQWRRSSPQTAAASGGGGRRCGHRTGRPAAARVGPHSDPVVSDLMLGARGSQAHPCTFSDS
eukprot:6192012-Pleurochrysis_carterae.AAC.1